MHIHGNQMNLNAINPYSAAAERAVAAQKAADVRKKLMNSCGVEGVSSPDEHFMMGQWMSRQNGQSFTEDEFPAGDSGRDSDFG
jgi:hypothetical protein